MWIFIPIIVLALIFERKPAKGTRGKLYQVARILGDAEAAKRGKVAKRVARRVVGREAGKLLGKLFK